MPAVTSYSSAEDSLHLFFSELCERPDLPVPQEPYGMGMYDRLPMLPPNISLRRISSQDEIKRPKRVSYVEVYLPPLKPRFIDPLFLDKDGSVKRLSEEDDYYNSLLNQQREVLDRHYAARVHLNPAIAKLINVTNEEIDSEWREALKRPRMGSLEFRRMLGETAMLAANHKLVRINAGELSDFSFWPG